jgi:DNA-binding NtrC family response regulator
MQVCSIPVQPKSPRIHPHSAVIASADDSFRQRMNATLTGLRWQVREASGGAGVWKQTEESLPEAVIVDSWLPDLDSRDFRKEFRAAFPDVSILSVDGTASEDVRGPHWQELLYALRCSQDAEGAARHSSPRSRESSTFQRESAPRVISRERPAQPMAPEVVAGEPRSPQRDAVRLEESERPAPAKQKLPEFVGDAPCLLEVSRRIRLVAPRSTPVLIEGPTGSGKELVAEALHRLSTRSRKPLVVINCAAIPETLLEAELFGHTRGAFTGAVQGRVGRIEAADGGTLFLDEIGELPLALQAKLLRFVERGELQRVGENDTVHVDVRLVAATHRPLAQQTQAGNFRADLYYRLAVFLIRTPPLSAHLEDLPELVKHFLDNLGREMPAKRIDAGGLAKLAKHNWPGNVRELEHVLERATILAGDAPTVTAEEIDLGLDVN